MLYENYLLAALRWAMPRWLQSSRWPLSCHVWVVLVHSCKSVFSFFFFYSQVSSAVTRKRAILVKSISSSTENLASGEKGNYTIESNQKWFWWVITIRLQCFYMDPQGLVWAQLQFDICIKSSVRIQEQLTNDMIFCSMLKKKDWRDQVYSVTEYNVSPAQPELSAKIVPLFL